MEFTIRSKIRSGYIIAFILLLVSYFLIFYTVKKLDDGSRDLRRSFTTINSLESLRADILNAETAVRGFLITKEIGFLMPYYETVRNIPRLNDQIGSHITDNSLQSTRLDSLKPRIQQHLDNLSAGIRLFQQAGLNISPEVIANRELEKATVNRIRRLIHEMKREEQKSMDYKAERLIELIRSTNFIAATSLVLVIITIIFSLVTYNRENKAKSESDQKAILYQKQLENHVEELKKVNAELQELKQIEKFAATGRIARTIAHEVRNPLTNITLASEQLMEGPVHKNESLLLEMINRNASRINQLVLDLLESTRFANLDYRRMHLNELLDQTMEMAKDRIDLKNIRVEKEYCTDNCEVDIDLGKMKLALLNIIVNAIESMENDKGVLRLKTDMKGDKCEITITDNGRGMDAETQAKIFEPYFTGKSNGTGLGLTNSQNIIFYHRGHIYVRSKPGKGTSFIVSLNGAHPS